MFRNLLITIALSLLAMVNAKPPRREDEPRVTGVGGIFFRSTDPAGLREWYAKAFGFVNDSYGTTFAGRAYTDSGKVAYCVWSPFKADTTYFLPSTREFMINFRVHDLEGLLAKLKGLGIEPVDSVATYDYGKFVHVMDPEGNKLELWEPVDEEYGKMAGEHITF